MIGNARWCVLATWGLATLFTSPAPAQSQGPPAAPADTLKRIRDTGAIVLGVRVDNRPFSFLDANRQPQGYTVDLCLRIAEAIKAELRLPRLEVRYVTVTPATGVAMVRDGTIDLECGSTTNTAALQEDVAFAYTTFVAGIRLLAKRTSNVASVEDLRGRTVVVTAGTAPAKLIAALDAERTMKLEILTAKDHDESFRAVADGRAVAFPMNDVLLYGIISTSTTPNDYRVVDKYLSVEPYAIMLRRNDPAFERRVNRTLDGLFRSGEIRRYYAKWFATRELTMPISPYLKEAFAVPNASPAFP